MLFSVGRAKKFIWPVDFSVDYRYSNHVPVVQTSASIRGESCQAELCPISCVNLLHHNEKHGGTVQFYPPVVGVAPFKTALPLTFDSERESPEHTCLTYPRHP